MSASEPIKQFPHRARITERAKRQLKANGWTVERTIGHRGAPTYRSISPLRTMCPHYHAKIDTAWACALRRQRMG